MRRSHRKRGQGLLVSHFPSLARQEVIDQNIFMFTQDVHTAVMPILARSAKHRDFSVELTGPEAMKEGALQLLAELGHRDGDDLRETVCDAVNEIAKRLSWTGSAAFEIVTDEQDMLSTESIPTEGLYRLPGYVVQLIPRGDRERWHRTFSIVESRNVWLLEMPTSLGGRRGYERMLRKLKKYQLLGPRFWRADLESGRRFADFDFQRYINDAEIYCRKITKVWGWNRRDWNQERSTEFFTFYKAISIRIAQAVLREHIVAEINGLFARLGIATTLVVKGLPTSSEMLKTRQDMNEGRLSFGKAYESTAL